MGSGEKRMATSMAVLLGTSNVMPELRMSDGEFIGVWNATNVNVISSTDLYLRIQSRKVNTD